MPDFLRIITSYKNPSFPYAMLTINEKTYTLQSQGFRYLHWHDDLQYTLVTKGELSIQVNGLMYHLRCGDGIFINCGLLHMIKKMSADGEYVSFNFPTKMISAFNGSFLEQNYVQPYTSDYNYPVLLLSSENQLHRNTLNILNQMREYNEHLEEYGMPYHIFSLITSLWLHTITLFNYSSTKLRKSKNNRHEYLRLMLSFIHKNYSSNISLDDIASCAHISVSECSRCFKSLLNVTPYGYLLNFRITKSTELLVDTNYSVAEIANMTGFNDSSHFIQYFKKIQKKTPNQYRYSS